MSFLRIGLIAWAWIGIAVAGSIADPSSFSVTPERLEAEITHRMNRVTEFAAITDWATQNDVRVWLAGGTAAGLAHGVKMDLEREWLDANGLPQKYFKSRFSYNYYDLYRSTQDADIVIDGSESQAVALEKFLREKFNYLQGSKSVWEVRLLRASRGEAEKEKDPILSKDFANQNSDSHSTGMIELSEPVIGESRVRDSFAWNMTGVSPFLSDITEGALTFIRNHKHSETKRYQRGYNPEILSVIRAYTKSFQYGVPIRAEGVALMEGIVAEFNPTAAMDPAAVRAIYSNALKLFRHSQDVEMSWEVLEHAGLRKKLIQFANHFKFDDLAYLLDRKPLRSFEVGLGQGATARSLGLETVSHATFDFLAYENITMSRRGVPNAFVSRKNVDGESASFGEGYYTADGRIGGRDSGLTVRYRLNPDAREGTDFRYIKSEGYVVVLNRAAIQTVDESLKLGLKDYYRVMLHSLVRKEDLGLLKMLGLKLRREVAALTEEDLKDLIKDALLFYFPKQNLAHVAESAEFRFEFNQLLDFQKGKVPTALEVFVLTRIVEAPQDWNHLKSWWRDALRDRNPVQFFFSLEYNADYFQKKGHTWNWKSLFESAYDYGLFKETKQKDTLYWFSNYERVYRNAFRRYGLSNRYGASVGTYFHGYAYVRVRKKLTWRCWELLTSRKKR